MTAIVLIANADLHQYGNIDVFYKLNFHFLWAYIWSIN